jgi:lysyl-tRNA synthetase class 2
MKKKKVTRVSKPLRGRCVQLTPLKIRNQSGLHDARVDAAGLGISVGDVVEFKNGKVTRLTPNLKGTSKWMDHVLDPRRLKGLKARQQVESGIREFFGKKHGFLEVRTPLLVPSPGMEPHIRPYTAGPLAKGQDAYLPTSPEFAMKRLLSGGLEKIFQMSPCFRSQPLSRTHHPEFLMLEWYRAYAGYEEIMRDTEELICFLAKKIYGKPVIPQQGRKIRVKTPWPRLAIRDLFEEMTGVDLVKSASRNALAEECRRLGIQVGTKESWDDLYFKIWLDLIEPKLPADQAVLVYGYPPSQAALSVLTQDQDGNSWAKRFEVYAGGYELGNAFEELTDAREQRRRFESEMAIRARTYGDAFPPNPVDEGFLGALEEGMPPSGGIAVGVDRLIMLLADEPDIEYTIWLPSEHTD